jgi:hypothetical protein
LFCKGRLENGQKCPKQAAFNFPGERKLLYCKEHITDEKMVNIKKKTCQIKGCNIEPIYGYLTVE